MGTAQATPESGVPRSIGVPEQLQSLSRVVGRLSTVVAVANRHGFWPLREALQPEIENLAREAEIEMDREEAWPSESGSSERAGLVDKIADVLLLELAMRSCAYRQCTAPFTYALHRLRAALNVPHETEEICLLCGAKNVQTEVASKGRGA